MLSSCFWEKTFSDPAVFWLMATFAVTAALVLVAWKQLGDLAGTNRADFVFRLRNNFFTEEARRLLFLAEEELLQFEDSEIPYFTIRNEDDPALRGRFKELGIEGSTVSTYAVDDVLLGPLEDVGLFLAEKLIKETHAYEMFETYVTLCWENEEIQRYIQSARRKPGDSDIYSRLDDLYVRLRRRVPKN